MKAVRSLAPADVVVQGDILLGDVSKQVHHILLLLLKRPCAGKRFLYVRP